MSRNDAWMMVSALVAPPLADVSAKKSPNLHAPFGAHRSGLVPSVSRQSPHACHSTGEGVCQSRIEVAWKALQTSGRALDTTSAPAARTAAACSTVVMKPVPQTGALEL